MSRYILVGAAARVMATFYTKVGVKLSFGAEIEAKKERPKYYQGSEP